MSNPYDESMRKQAQALLVNFWHSVRLEMRRAGFCATRLALVETLLKDATGESDLVSLRAAAGGEATATVTLDRDNGRVIFRRLFPSGDLNDFTHAGGDVVCPTCGYKYYDHPSLNGQAKGLRMLCDGKKVKV